MEETVVSANLAEGKRILIKATPIKGVFEDDQLVNARDLPFEFQSVSDSISDIAKSIQETLRDIQPDKATVEFGVEIGVDTSGLVALLAKGSGKANLTVTLEWSKNA